MNYDISCNPSYSVLELTLEPGERIVAESGAMAWMDTHVKTETSTRGGVMKGLKRKLLTKESFFQNTYSVEQETGTIAFTPGSAGDIVPITLQGQELVLEKGAYLASEEGVQCDSKWGGFRGLFNEGMFLLRCSGTGLMFFHSYGAIEQIDVDGEYIVDNGFAVAWDPSLEYRITKARRIRSFLFSDQLMLRFEGRGRLWVQSRSGRTLSNWVYPWRPQPPRSND